MGTVFLVFLSLAMGALGWFTAHMAYRARWARVLRRKAWMHWLFTAEEKATHLIHAQTEVAVLKAELADLIVEMPEPFEGAVLELSRFGYNFEQAALAEGARRGAYHLCDPVWYRPPKPVIPAMGVETSCEVTPSTPPPQLPEATLVVPVAPLDGPPLVFQNGVWVPR